MSRNFNFNIELSSNKKQILIDWVNTFNESSCLMVNHVHDLENGLAVIRILINYLRFFIDKFPNIFDTAKLNKYLEDLEKLFNNNPNFQSIHVILCGILSDLKLIAEYDNLEKIKKVSNEEYIFYTLYVIKKLFERNYKHSVQSNHIGLNKNVDTDRTRKNRSPSPLNRTSKSNSEFPKENLKHKNTVQGIPMKTNVNINYCNSTPNSNKNKVTFIEYLKPTQPIIYIDSSEFHKYQTQIHNKTKQLIFENKQINISSSATDEIVSKPSFNKENHFKQDIRNKFSKENIVEWLHNRKLISSKTTNLDDVINKCSSGILLADLINLLEGKNAPIKGIIRESEKITIRLLNIKKVLEFLRKIERFDSQHLFDSEEILQSNEDTITQLLIDIHEYYCKNEIKYLQIKPRSYNSSILKKIPRQNVINNYKTYDNVLSERINKTLSSYSIDNIKCNEVYESATPTKQTQPSQIKSEICNSVNKLLTCNKSENEIRKANLFITFDSDNIKKIKKEINNISNSGSSSFNNNNDVVYKKNQKGKVHFMKSYCKSNSFNSNRTSKTYLVTEENEIKNWLSSLGISFAHKIDFNKSNLQEFKDGLLLIQIISKLELKNRIKNPIKYPNSKATALINIKKVLEVLKLRKNIPTEYLYSEEEIYNADSNFILSFLKVIKKVYNKENQFNNSLNEKLLIRSKSNKSMFNKSLNLSPVHSYIANGRDNSKGDYSAISQSQRKIFLMHPKFFWE